MNQVVYSFDNVLSGAFSVEGLGILVIVVSFCFAFSIKLSIT